jgi:hypothetical protein
MAFFATTKNMGRIRIKDPQQFNGIQNGKERALWNEFIPP